MSASESQGGYGGRLAVGTASNLAATGMVFLCNFLLTPFLLATLGDARYSIFVLAQSIIGFSRLLTLGIPASLSRFLSVARAQEDPERLNRDFTTGVVLLGVLGLLAICGVGAVAALFSRIFPGVEGYGAEASWVLLILGLQLALAMPLAGFQTVYHAVQRFHVPSVVRLVGAPLRVLTIFLVFSAGYVKLVLWAIIASFFEVAQGIYLALHARRVLPELRFRPSLIRTEHIKRLTGFSIWVFLGNLGFLLYYNTDYLLIHWLVDPEQIAHYNLAARWDPMLRMVISSFAALLIPVTAGLGAREDLGEIRQLLVRATRYCLLVALPACLLLVVFSRPFLEAWAGPAYGEVAPVMVVLLVPLILTLSQTPSFSVFVGLGKVKVNGLLTVSFGILNVLLSIYLVTVWKMGLMGIALGTAVTYIIRTGMISPWYVCRITGQPLGGYVIRGILVPILVSVPMVVAGYVLRLVFAPQSLPAITGAMAAASVTFFLPAWYLVLDRRDRGTIRSWGSGLVRRLTRRS